LTPVEFAAIWHILNHHFSAQRVDTDILQRTMANQLRHSNARTNEDSMSTEPLAVTLAKARQLSNLSHSSLYKLINENQIETVRVLGRRLIIYESLKKVLGIRPDGEPAPVVPGLAGGKIKDPPGRRRKQRATVEQPAG
jgi:hypothetical protein